ncbi:MAG: J domain-containing protein [Verrucomicrobiales bacterium]
MARQRGSDFELTLVARDGAALSAAQVEFNKLMKRLESARVKHQREQARLDALLTVCGGQLIPLIEEFHRLNYQLVIDALEAMGAYKLTRRRREWLKDLIRHKATALVVDSCGLTDDQTERMRLVVDELRDPEEEQAEEDEENEEYEFLRTVIEAATRDMGVDLDLSDLDFRGDKAEFERKLQERLDAATAAYAKLPASSQGRTRKPTKAQIEKEKRKQEAEEAKQRDLKSLYKQLAKVLHPDLESDSSLQQRKEDWMKRLTAAYAASDLRELLCIEMEWLGVEASNLMSATDEKLGVYGMVLKEQIAELKRQTEDLINQPQYSVLTRFRDPHFGYIPPVGRIKVEIQAEIDRHHRILGILRQGGPECQKMLNKWADENAQAARFEASLF